MDVVVCFDFLPRIGGAHLWMYEQYRRWPTPVRVITAQYSQDPRERDRERAFDEGDHGAVTVCRVVPARDINLIDPRYWIACLRQVRAIASQAGGAVTHVHALRAFPEGFTAMLYRRTCAPRARLITYAHGEEILVARTSRQMTLVARSVYSASDLVIANSEGTTGLVAALCPSARIVKISPGVDVAAFDQPEEAVREYRRAWGWGDDTVVIATVARMERRKNHAMLLEAVAALRRKRLPVAYFCGGDGEERRQLEQLSAALQIEPWVRFPGAISDAEKRLAFAACQIHAMPAIQVGPMIEGFGIVFVEAAAAGVPSIAGDNGGQKEAVLDGQTGIVVDGTNLDSVCAAIETLVKNPALRLRMGAEGRKWAAQHDWGEIARKARAEIGHLT